MRGVSRWHAGVCSAVLVLMHAVTASAEEASPPPRFTVQDAVRFRNVLEPMRHRDTEVLHSPDGRRFAVLLTQGDLEKNGNWLEVLSGSTESIQAAARARVVARLFTASLKDDQIGLISPTHPSWNRAVWLDDNERLVLLWSDGRRPTQVTAINVRTGRVEELTHHPTAVLRYSISADGRHLVYSAYPKLDVESATERKERGYVITGSSALNALAGRPDGTQPWQRLELFVQSAGEAPRQVDIGSFALRTYWPSPFSPNARFVLCELSITTAPPPSWQRYEDADLKRLLTVYQDYGEEVSQASQLAVVDVVRARAYPLLDAPSGKGFKLLWSANGENVVVGPTFLPPAQAGTAGLRGRAVVEVNLQTGAFQEVPLPVGASERMEPLHWAGDGLVLGNEHTRLTYTKTAGVWRPAPGEVRIPQGAAPKRPIEIELKEDLNTPPALYARDSRTQVEKMIFDLNPGYRRAVTQSRVEMVRWTDRTGREWRGRLYYPVEYSSSQRYPLVVQTHGYAPPSEFSLSGLDYTGSVFAAVTLAHRGFFVVQVQDYREALVTPEEPRIHMEGYEGAVDYLRDRGFIDPARVGIVGFSRSGWYVEYTLAHSGFRFASALVADNIDGSYVQAVLFGGVRRREFELDNGAGSVGEGLKTWLDSAPGFNTHLIRTPLRLEVDTGADTQMLSAWEMYANLRYQKKPVELFVIPDSQHADHPLQIPAQKVASQEGAVEWFDFWLNGREDASPSKSEQYVRWRELRRLQQAAPVAAEGNLTRTN